MTSDGLPHSEMAACLAAGPHPNLIPVLGQVLAHPAARQGLAMPLIDPAFRVLAGPPSLASCTRDLYAPDTRFGPRVALRMALGVASAARQLHERGILHGDLYAHNILRSEAGQVLLGDFGAASFYPADAGTRQGFLLERIEVRALGCLLEELGERCTVAGEGVAGLLQTLSAACLAEVPAARPGFAEIERQLAQALAGEDVNQR